MCSRAVRSPRGLPANLFAKVFADVTLDAAFTSNLGLSGLSVNACAVQSDGKILLGGNFSAVGSTIQAYLARFNADGTVDASFTPFFNLPVFALLIQPDGAILVGGQFFTNPGSTRRGIMRLLPHGTQDPTFDPGTGANNTVQSLALDASGRILLTGSFTGVRRISRWSVPWSCERMAIGRLLRLGDGSGLHRALAGRFRRFPGQPHATCLSGRVPPDR